MVDRWLTLCYNEFMEDFMKKSIVTGIVLGLISFNVFALGATGASCRIASVVSPYIGIMAHFNKNKWSQDIQEDVKKNVTSETLLGGLQVMELVDLEGGITYFNKNKMKNTHLDALLIFPLSERFTLLAGPGVGKLSHDKKSLPKENPKDKRAHGLRLHAAAQYKWTEKLAIRVNLHSQKGTKANKRVSAGGVGLIYSF